MDFNEKKFKELVLYISKRSESDPTFGAVKLNKVLFLADFLAYAVHNKPITGAEYIRLDHGPGPKLMGPIRDEMAENDEIVEVIREHFGYPQRRIIAKREPDLSEFSGTEIALVDLVIDEEKDANATELSEMTHRMLGWRVAAHREVIPYSTVFLSDEPVTEEDRVRAQELAVQYGW